MSDLALRFLTRPQCHLCDDARPIVNKEAKRAGWTVTEVNIDTDDDLLASYGMRIPVVLTPDDLVIAEGIISDGISIRKSLKRVGKS